MNRISYYEVKLGKIVCGGNRNISSYYVVLKDEKQPVKYISKAMRLDEDNEDTVTGEVEIKPTLLEVWNYDKMKLVGRYKIDFKQQSRFTWTIFEDNMELSVERRNEWEEEMKKRKEGEEAESSSVRESGPVPQKSEAASSKIASNSPSKLIKTSSQQPKKLESASQIQMLPPNPKRINDSVAKVTPKSESEIKVEVISIVEY
jgi:hypothetical protein